MFKKSNKSGPSSAAVEKAKKDLDPYLFFSWTDQYLKPRGTKSNMSRINYESSESMEENEGVDDEDDKGSYPHMEESADVNEKICHLPQSRKNRNQSDKHFERTCNCFSPFLKHTGENVSGRVLIAHYVSSQSSKSSLGSPEYLLCEPANVHQLQNTKLYKDYFELISHGVRS